MVWLIGSLIYASIALAGARLFAGHFAWMFHANTPSYRSLHRPDGDQWFGAWCLALVVAAIWPLVILPALISKRFAIGNEAAERAREQRVWIAELEKELGIR